MDREMSALERLSNEPEVVPAAGRVQDFVGNLSGNSTPQVPPLTGRVAELQMKLNSVEIEHAKAIKDLYQRLSQLERIVNG